MSYSANQRKLPKCLTSVISVLSVCARQQHSWRNKEIGWWWCCASLTRGCRKFTYSLNISNGTCQLQAERLNVKITRTDNMLRGGVICDLQPQWNVVVIKCHKPSRPNQEVTPKIQVMHEISITLDGFRCANNCILLLGGMTRPRKLDAPQLMNTIFKLSENVALTKYHVSRT